METVRYIYNGANQVECIDADANGACNGTEFWVYDAHGNLTFDRTTRYVYDAANHLATVCDSGDGLTCDVLGNETTYQYNGDGARVAQSVRKGILPATLTTYTLDTTLPLTQVLSETTSGQTTRYLHGLDLIAQSDGTSAEYFAYDGLGSVRQIVDGTGTVLTSQTFDPYGTPYSEMSAEQSAFGFTGEQTDENGLVYLRARYYNPSQGRFMQIDPSRLERNGYQYAGSSPTMFSDPSGHCVDMQEILTFLSPIPGPRPALKDMWNECQANWSTFWNVASNPDNDFNNVAHSFSYYVNPLGIQVRNTWAGLAELSAANSRWVGASGYGQWLGKIELFGIAPGRWLGWGADTSSYYQDAEHPYRYVEDLGTIFVPTYGAGLTVAFAAQGSMAQAQRNALAEAQANANVARQWAYLNEYYPSSAIGTAAPGTLSRLVNGFASQRAANAIMAMPEYQVPAGGVPVYAQLGMDIRPDLSPAANELRRIFRRPSLGGIDPKTGLPRGQCDICANNVSPIVRELLGEGYAVEIAKLGYKYDPYAPLLRVVDPTGQSPYVAIATRGFHETVKITNLSGSSYYVDAWTYLYTRSVQPLTWSEYIGQYWLDAEVIIEMGSRSVGSTRP